MPTFNFFAIEIKKDNFAEIAENLDGYSADDIEMESAFFLDGGHRVFLIVNIKPMSTEFIAIITESYFDKIWTAIEPKDTNGFFEIAHK